MVSGGKVRSAFPSTVPHLSDVPRFAGPRSKAMSSTQMSPLFLPITRAFSQLDDRVFVGVAVRSVVWSAASFAAIYAAAVGIVHWLLNFDGMWAWAADILGAVGALLLAIFLFLPV